MDRRRNRRVGIGLYQMLLILLVAFKCGCEDPNATNPKSTSDQLVEEEDARMLQSILQDITTSLPDTTVLEVEDQKTPKEGKPQSPDSFLPPPASEPDYSWKYADKEEQRQEEDAQVEENNDYEDEEDDDDEEDEELYDPNDIMMSDFVQLAESKGGKKGFRKKKNRKQGTIRRKDFGNFSNEYRIKRILFNNYDKTTRPVRNDSTTTTLYLGMSLYHILDTNEKYQTLSALIAIRLRWHDEYLTWDPADYGGVNQIWVPALHVWTPDIFINNFADDSFQDFMNTFAIVSANGDVLWMFPAVIKTYCTLDVQHFPFDHQKCNIIFISWTFNGLKLDVTYNRSEQQAVYYTPKNQEWYVDNVTVERHEKIYACCVEPYPDVTFTIHMTRRSLFYIINLIFPCLLIYAVSFLGFYLPVESGEKVNLEITILLALVVFLLIVGETLPPTPDAIPVLGVLFGTTMIMVSIALVMAVIVTNLYLRKDSETRAPLCVRRIFLGRSKVRKNSNPPTPKIMLNENHIHNHDTKFHDGIEIDNMSTMSEIEGLTCQSDRCFKKKSKVYRVPDAESSAIISYEWQQLARMVDRVCFWLFLFSSIAALTTMFSQIPRYI